MIYNHTYLAGRLLNDGYCIVPGLCSLELVDALNRDFDPRFECTPFCEGGFFGARTKRFGALLRRSDQIHCLVQQSLVLEIIQAVLGRWCDRIVLNLTQAVELHPGALAQIPHRDHDLWGGPKGETEYQVNVLWPLTRFTSDNGATLLWPGSHRLDASPEPVGAPLVAAMEPGSALLWLGSLVHGGGANVSLETRRGVIVSYCLGWLRTFENQYLVYPPNIARGFNPALAALVGYAQHRPNLGNVEGQCPSILFYQRDVDGLAAIDALRPEQASALADYITEQEAARAGLIGG